MAGALAVGRPAVVLGGALSGGWLTGAAVGSVLGPVGTAVGALVGGVAGLYAANKLEQKTKIGRLVGGMVGATIGSAAGKVADWLGAQPGKTLSEECKGFSLSSLPKKLLDPHYSSHQNISEEVAKEGARHALPGDIIITNHDPDFKLELVQRAVGLGSRVCEALGLVEKGHGAKADWTHIYTVDQGHSVIDILLDGAGPSRFPLEFAFTDNGHAKILRPEYSSEESKQAYLDWMNSKFGRVGYDLSFDLKSEDKFYCQEFVYKGLEATNPDLKVQPSQIGLGPWKREFITADNFDQNPKFKEVWSTGSNFWVNWLSHFT